MIFSQDNVMKIVYEQCKTFEARHELDILTEAETARVSNTVLADLYQDIVEKPHVDYGDIPKSRGRVEKYKGTANMIKSLDIIDQICAKSGNNDSDCAKAITIVKDAIVNLSNQANKFEAGFKTENDYIMVLYNAVLLSCVEATSYILSSYIDFAKRIDGAEFKLIDDPDRSGELQLYVLRDFNYGCKTGEIPRSMNESILNNRKNFGGVTVATALAVGAGATLIIPTIRNLIFGVYYSRMKLSDFLAQQAQFIEANNTSVKNLSGLSPQEKDRISNKQLQSAAKLMKLSDKIRVDYKLASQRGHADTKKANEKYTLKNVNDKVIGNQDFALF